MRVQSSGEPREPSVVSDSCETTAGLVLHISLSAQAVGAGRPAAIYTIQYDGIANFPRYPIDLLADLNAYFGALYLHGTYPNLAAAQLANAMPLPVSPGYTGLTSYYLIPALNLPLLEPLRQLGVPAPIIDLIQPVLRVIVDLGYGTGYANIPTPAGLLPPINLLTLVTELLQAGGQGVEDALLDVL